jgi:uncharacterized protein YlxP (DUF503 family)
VYVGAVELDVLFGDVHSLKQKRSLVRPVIAELRRRFEVAAAEAGHVDLHRRSLIGVAAVAADAGRVRELLAACERLVAGRPELDGSPNGSPRSSHPAWNTRSRIRG